MRRRLLGNLVARARRMAFLRMKKRKILPKRASHPSSKVHREAARRAEAKVITKALEMTNYNRKKAAELLNISYKSLLYKIKECGINKRKNSEN